MEIQQIGDYVTVDLASKLLSTTYSRVSWLVQSGRLPHTKIGHTRLVRISDIEKLRTEQENAPKSVA